MSRATTTETNQYLHRWGNAKTFCHSLRKEIKEWHKIINDSYELESQSFVTISKASMPSDPTARTTDRVLRIIEQYKQYISGLERRLADELRFLSVMDEVIAELPSNERDVICLYYRDMKEKRWPEVAAELGYSQSHTEKLAGIATKRISKRIEIEIKLDSF